MPAIHMTEVVTIVAKEASSKAGNRDGTGRPVTASKSGLAVLIFMYRVHLAWSFTTKLLPRLQLDRFVAWSNCYNEG